MLKECPVGYVLRNAPQTYDVLAVSSWVDKGCLNPMDTPKWLQDALRVVVSEKGRLAKQRQESESSKSQSDYGIRAIRNR